MGGVRVKVSERCLCTLTMVLVQLIYALVNIFYKLAANNGMSLSVLVAYRFIFGAAFILPLALLRETTKTRSLFTFKVFLYGFLAGVLGGSLGQNLMLRSLVLTSATFVSAISNLIPAITLLLAIAMRLEKLDWKRKAGKSKALGTVIGIAGAMLATFYKGPAVDIWNTHINLISDSSSHHHIQAHTYDASFLLGAALAVVASVLYSIWFIVQVAKEFPCPYTTNAIMNVSASIQGVAYSLCIHNTDWIQWKLGWNIRLLSVFVVGILGSGVVFTLVLWCIRKQGPLFVSAFQPLMLLMVAIAGSLFLEEKMHLGMVLGAMLIIGGLYLVLWGKNMEMEDGHMEDSNSTIISGASMQVEE